MKSAPTLTRSEWRKLIQKKRLALSAKQQQDYAQSLARILEQKVTSLTTVKSSPIKLAIYLANNGELNPQPFIEWCWQQTLLNIEVYLPVIHPFCPGNLLFFRYQPQTIMVKNTYGIMEPKLNILQLCPAHQLDIIFTPLVAFDKQGNRLGMGGGFYDRTLAHVNINNTAVIGLAHQCQQVEQLPTELWDIPLPTIITPEKSYSFVKQ